MKILICSDQSNSIPVIISEEILTMFDNELNIYAACKYPKTFIIPEYLQALKNIGMEVNQFKIYDIKALTKENFDYIINLYCSQENQFPMQCINTKTTINIDINLPQISTDSVYANMIGILKMKEKLIPLIYSFYTKIKSESYANIELIETRA